MSDDHLKRLFKLRQSVKNSSAPLLSRQTLYVRSYRLKVEQLHYLLLSGNTSAVTIAKASSGQR